MGNDLEMIQSSPQWTKPPPPTIDELIEKVRYQRLGKEAEGSYEDIPNKNRSVGGFAKLPSGHKCGEIAP